MTGTISNITGKSGAYQAGRCLLTSAAHISHPLQGAFRATLCWDVCTNMCIYCVNTHWRANTLKGKGNTLQADASPNLAPPQLFPGITGWWQKPSFTKPRPAYPRLVPAQTATGIRSLWPADIPMLDTCPKTVKCLCDGRFPGYFWFKIRKCSWVEKGGQGTVASRGLLRQTHF